MSRFYISDLVHGYRGWNNFFLIKMEVLSGLVGLAGLAMSVRLSQVEKLRICPNMTMAGEQDINPHVSIYNLNVSLPNWAIKY